MEFVLRSAFYLSVDTIDGLYEVSPTTGESAYRI
jgi:hypothetical protein